MTSLCDSPTGIPRFVTKLYQNILDHDPEDQADIDYWMNHTRFHGIASTISGFFTSDEFMAHNLSQEVIVDKLYGSILGREGEGDGKNYWLCRLRRGDAIQSIVNGFVGSAEYRQKAQDGVVPPPGIPIFTCKSDGGISDFIKTLYQNILSRDSDIQGGIDYWTEHTRFHGISSTIVGFFTSDEFKAKNFPQEVVVDKLYHSILGREGRGDGKNYWLDRLRRGDTTQMIVNDFVGSAEYRQKVGEGVVPPPGIPIFIWKSDGKISDFIRTLYQNILTRDLEIQGGIDYWTEHTRFHGIASTISGFFTSDEFKARNLAHEIIVNKLYRSILGREGENDEKNYWLGRLRRGDAIQMVINDCVGSAEYRQKALQGVVPPPGIPIFTRKSDGGISDFVRTLYQNILNRDLEIQGGIDYWTKHIHFHGIASAVSGFFTSDEFQAKNLPQEVVVDKLYRSILGREGEDDEKNHWLDRLRRGDAIQLIINDFVGSAEYRQKAREVVVPPPGIPIFTWNPAGGTPDFIKTLYQNVLSRDAEDQAAIDNWTNHTHHHGLISTLRGFFSDEFKAKNLPEEVVVDKLYRSILGREAHGDDEKNVWLCKLRRGDTMQMIINDFVGSAEYRQKVQNNTAPHPVFWPQ